MIFIINNKGTLIKGTKDGWRVTLKRGVSYLIPYNDKDNGTEINSFSLWPFSNCSSIPYEDYQDMSVSRHWELKKKSLFGKFFGLYNKTLISMLQWDMHCSVVSSRAYAHHEFEMTSYTDDTDDIIGLSSFNQAYEQEKSSKEKYEFCYDPMPNDYSIDLSEYPGLENYYARNAYLR